MIKKKGLAVIKKVPRRLGGSQYLNQCDEENNGPQRCSEQWSEICNVAGFEEVNSHKTRKCGSSPETRKGEK